MTDPEKNIEFIDEKKEKKEIKFFSFKDLLTGSLLTRKDVIKQIPFILFLVLFALIYIANRYNAEKIYRKISNAQTEVRNLRTKQIFITSELMKISKPSEVVKSIREKNLGLEELTESPKVLIKKKNDS